MNHVSRGVHSLRWLTVLWLLSFKLVSLCFEERVCLIKTVSSILLLTASQEKQIHKLKVPTNYMTPDPRA